jgi:hypothetical protein
MCSVLVEEDVTLRLAHQILQTVLQQTISFVCEPYIKPAHTFDGTLVTPLHKSCIPDIDGMLLNTHAYVSQAHYILYSHTHMYFGVNESNKERG